MSAEPIAVVTCIGFWAVLFVAKYVSDSRRFVRERAERLACYRERYPWMREPE